MWKIGSWILLLLVVIVNIDLWASVEWRFFSKLALTLGSMGFCVDRIIDEYK